MRASTARRLQTLISWTVGAVKSSPATIRSMALWMGACTALVAFAVLGAFYLEFRSEPIQHDSGAWSNFATYFSGLFGPIVAMVNLFALLLVAVVVTDHQQNALASKRLALDMLAQWNGAELHESRRVVSDLIDAVDGPGQLPTLRELELARSAPSLHAFRLYHFFEQWAVLHAMGEIDHKILATAIGSRALWYRDHFFGPITDREKNPDILRTLKLIESNLFEDLERRVRDA